MGSTTDTSLTNMIQDAILKLCTHNITFTKSLEIDGIICVSPGEAQPDIVVKMHRTILKPQTKPDPPVKSWDETYNTNPNPHPFTTGYTLPQVSYPQGDQRMSYASAIPDRSRTFVRNTNTGSPRNRRTHTTHTAATHEQPEVEFATHDPTQENLPTPGETIPVATQMTPVGLAETSAQGPEDSQCSRSEEEEQQTSLTSKNPDNKRKVESETFSNDDPPDKQAKIEIKEEPITIEVNDEDDDINDGDMNTGDWMQDNTLDSLDNTAEQNGNTQQQMQGTDPNSGVQQERHYSHFGYTRTYQPKTRPVRPLSKPQLIRVGAPIPEGHTRLVNDAEVVVKQSWLVSVLASAIPKQKHYNSMSEYPSKVIKALIDGMYEPHELYKEGGVNFYERHQDFAPVIHALRAYTALYLKQPSTVFTKAWNEKVRANRQIMSKFSNPAK